MCYSLGAFADGVGRRTSGLRMDVHSINAMKKRKTKASPMQMSLAKHRAQGQECAIVEKFNHFAKIRQDAFGWMDILCYDGNMTLGIQSTTGSNLSSRKAKLDALPAVHTWVRNSWNRHAVIEAWSKTGPRGRRKVWTCREVWL